jgi:tripartite-type tricarboxylate transporter receptor subunit TctC
MTPPNVVINGGSGSGNDLTNSLIQAEMAKKLMNKQ